ncbi:MAG: circularly permuted type 2 ATP-grasp protein [Planctomycetaceae bacterium]|nr:circularly permuted type 2 ATP-grasp protein [Planctomycetaceae bacterium]
MAKLTAYAGPTHAYDEFKFSNGEIRPQWHSLLEALGDLDEEEMSTRWRTANRLLQENGVNITGFEQEHQTLRPWEIDLLPAVYSQQDWRFLGEGVSQRAQLIREIVRDLYGDQNLLIEGILPTDLVFKNQEFLRHYSLLPMESSDLLLYGCELARGPSGQWWVMADRGSAPAGLSYTLENRIVLSNTLPQFLRKCQIYRLAPYFIDLQETIKRLTSDRTSNPFVVLMSGGPGHPFHFEDVFLARYLGIPLVEPDDLTIRKNQLWLKTLAGLNRVDVLLRRTADHRIDPLELGGPAPNGVSGLLNVMRLRNVTMLNGPEYGLLDSPVFMPYLRACCQRLLNADLILPSIATWWCGEPAAWATVKRQFENLVIKPAFSHSGSKEYVVSDLTTKERDQLIAQIEKKPWDYVAQEKIIRSTAPCWIRDQIVPGYLAVRTFAVQKDGHFETMNGGLIRVETSPKPMPLSVSAGQYGKDIWIQSDRPVAPISLLARIQEPPELQRGNQRLPSRAADNLYWLGRYLERLEFSARLIRKITERMLSESNQQASEDLMPMLGCLAEQGLIEESFALEGFFPEREKMETVWTKLIWENRNGHGLEGLCGHVIRISSLVRDRMSEDFWRATLHMKETVRPGRGVSLIDLKEMMTELIQQISAITGQIDDGLVHGPTRTFLRIGRSLERARQLAIVLKKFLQRSNVRDVISLVTLLDVCNSIMTYRSRYRGNFAVLPVFDLLVTDTTNPRAILFQFDTLKGLLEELPYRHKRKAQLPPEWDTVRRIRNELQSLLPVSSSKVHWTEYRPGVVELLRKLDDVISEISNQLTATFFVHAEFTQQMDQRREGEVT